jgi:hypothetical protein
MLSLTRMCIFKLMREIQEIWKNRENVEESVKLAMELDHHVLMFSGRRNRSLALKSCGATMPVTSAGQQNPLDGKCSHGQEVYGNPSLHLLFFIHTKR